MKRDTTPLPAKASKNEMRFFPSAFFTIFTPAPRNGSNARLLPRYVRICSVR